MRAIEPRRKPIRDDVDVYLIIVSTDRTDELALGVGVSLVSLLVIVGGLAAELLGLSCPLVTVQAKAG